MEHRAYEKREERRYEGNDEGARSDDGGDCSTGFGCSVRYGPDILYGTLLRGYLAPLDPDR
jgi:hypothetical protein